MLKVLLLGEEIQIKSLLDSFNSDHIKETKEKDVEIYSYTVNQVSENKLSEAQTIQLINGASLITEDDNKFSVFKNSELVIFIVDFYVKNFPKKLEEWKNIPEQLATQQLIANETKRLLVILKSRPKKQGYFSEGFEQQRFQEIYSFREEYKYDNSLILDSDDNDQVDNFFNIQVLEAISKQRIDQKAWVAQQNLKILEEEIARRQYQQKQIIPPVPSLSALGRSHSLGNCSRLAAKPTSVFPRKGSYLGVVKSLASTREKIREKEEMTLCTPSLLPKYEVTLDYGSSQDEQSDQPVSKESLEEFGVTFRKDKDREDKDREDKEPSTGISLKDLNHLEENKKEESTAGFSLEGLSQLALIFFPPRMPRSDPSPRMHASDQKSSDKKQEEGKAGFFQTYFPSLSPRPERAASAPTSPAVTPRIKSLTPRVSTD